jgi:hypothetical protein
VLLCEARYVGVRARDVEEWNQEDWLEDWAIVYAKDKGFMLHQ